MKFLQKKKFRAVISYVAAVWIYGMVFALISGVYPDAFIDWIRFFFMPVLITIQLPFLFLKGSGWLFVTVAGLLSVGIYYLLAVIADRKGRGSGTSGI